MSKHTPGPWKFQTAWRLVGPTQPIVELTYLSKIDRQNTFNAALIAAAPELLEMLKFARAQLHANGLTLDELAPYDKAINKAEGREDI